MLMTANNNLKRGQKRPQGNIILNGCIDLKLMKIKPNTVTKEII